MNHRWQRNNASQEPHLNFRNTRSKFYKQKPSNLDGFADRSPNESPQKNTGNYWKEQGNIQFKKGNLPKAIEYYSKAIEKSPSESVYFCNRAKCHKLMQNLKQALKDAEEACELDPDSIKANYICGCLLAEMGKSDKTKLAKAENRFKKALRLCSTLKKQQYEDEISLKYFRLKKLIFYLDQQEQIDDLLLEKNFLTSQITTSKHPLQKVLTRIDQKIEQLNNFAKMKEIPDHLCCKITLELMEDPVTTEQGLTYEKSALEDHFKTNGLIEPISRKKLTSIPYPNVALKIVIQQFLKENPWAFEHGCEQHYLQIRF